jgi:hypothetical protein
MGARLEGLALSWRSGQAFYVPLNNRADLVAELAPLFAAPLLEKATWDLRAQMAALLRVLGRGVLGVPGADMAGEVFYSITLATTELSTCLAWPDHTYGIPSL